MAGPEYERVASADADGTSDASGSDLAGDHDTSSRATRRKPRTSEDVRQHDREILAAEEEAERLLTGEEKDASGLDRIFRRDGAAGQGKSRRANKKPARRRGNGDVLYEVEQGGEPNLSGESSGNSSEVDLRRLGETHAKRRSRALRWSRFICLHIFLFIVFIGLLFGAYKASRGELAEPTPIARLLSNGTSTFAPTTILISLDGFRADFLQRNLTPTLNAFIRDGVSPEYMLPSFPSLTFPNHYTLVTGHYPESHGIVGNTFWDPTTNKEFYYTDPARSMTPEWWNAEPLWETAEMQYIRTAIHMWPGSEAHIGSLEPAYVDEFNPDESLDNKVARILGWLDLPGPEDDDANPNRPRPQLIAAYVPDVDSDGHKYGPNSTEIRNTISRADKMLADLFRGIDERNLADVVNIIVVSDHGMATTDVTRLIQFEDLIDPRQIEHTDGWPLYGLRAYDTSERALTETYELLMQKANETDYQDSFDVYLRDSTMPERYHFSNNQRIAPLWIIPKAGWAIVTKEEFDVEAGLKKNEVYTPRGLHGYDFEHPLMRAIFVARGPAFPHPKGSRVDVFQNTEVYNMVCDSLGIEPRPNNGTLRLPLKTVGLHDDKAPVDTPDDPPASTVPFVPAIMPLPIPTDMPSLEIPPISGVDPSNTAEQSVIWTTDAQGSLITVSPDADADSEITDSRPAIHDGTLVEGTGQDENLNNQNTWLDWFEDEFNDFKEWTSSVYNGDGADTRGEDNDGK